MDNRAKQILGRNVRRARVRRGLTKSEFCLMVGISRPLLNEIERGECNARLDSLIRISEGFDCEVWELMSPSGLTSRGDQL